MKSKLLIILPILVCFFLSSLAQAAPVALKKGDKAPAFTASTINGGTLKFEFTSDMKMPLIIDIWATWCGPCRKEMPELQKLYDKYAGQFEIVAVSVDDPGNLNAIKKFVDDNKITFKVVHDSDGKISEKYYTKSIPYLVIIDQDGTILETVTGFNPKLENELVSLLDLLEPQTSADFVERGYFLYDMRSNLDKAFSDFDTAVSMDSSNSKAICGRGEIYLERGDFEKAAADLDKAIELDSKNVRAWFNRGMVEEKQRNFDKAAEFYENGLISNPGNQELEYFKQKLGSRRSVISKPEPDIIVTTIGGEKLSLSDYIGKKAVIVDCWATWCPPCRMELPKLQEFYTKHSDQVEIIAISAEKDGDSKIPEFIKTNGFTFKVVYDPDRKAYDKFPTKGIPFLTIIGKDGTILDTLTGYNPDVIQELEELLNL